MDLSLGSDPAVIAWRWDAPRFVRAYRAVQTDERLDLPISSIAFDEASLERLMMLGYVRVRGDAIAPAQRALDAEAADAGIEALRELISLIGTPYAENLARAVESPTRERTVYPLRADASPLVEAGWLSERTEGYSVTIHGVGALEDVLAHSITNE